MKMVSSQLLKFLISPPNLFALRGAKKQVFDLLRHRDRCLVRQTSGLWMQQFQVPLTTSPLSCRNDSQFLITIPWTWSPSEVSHSGSTQLCIFSLEKPVTEAIGFVVMAVRSSRDTLFTSSLFSFPYSRLQVHLDGKDCVLYPFVANTSRQAYPLAHVSWEGGASYRPWWPACL